MYNVYVLYDKITEKFGMPFYDHNHVSCKRSVKRYFDSKKQEEVSPVDFELRCIGAYDEKTGEVFGHQAEVINHVE